MSEWTPDWLRQRALISPERLAVVAGGERLSFRELDRRVNGVAGWLRAQGVGQGDRVALLLRNGLPFVTLVHALSRLGAILVPLNIRLTPAELRWQIADVRARLLIHDESNSAIAHDLADIPRALVDDAFNFQPLTSNLQLPTSNFILASPHSILYTSGTTGQPKGAVLTYGNHWWSAVGSALNLGLQADDRWLACLPLFHVGGLAILLRSVIYGHPVIVHESFDPVAVNRAIDEEGVTLISMVATMLQRTLEARGERPYPPTLRCILLGGGPAPKALLEACARCGLPAAQTYGLTEAASQVATLAPEEALRKLGSAGKPLMMTEVRIERDGVPVEAGEAGEIVIRGPTVTPGYDGRPEANAESFHQGWFRTGDIGTLDSEGYLYVLDRRDDVIISGGENVYPAEVEAVLRAHPAVEDAGVIGVPDEQWGQAPMAFVVLREPIGEAELKLFCAERLAGYKVPRQIRVVGSLPRNPGGKLLRRSLALDSK
jgi:O-succinylbenzoic acid--CoA ligase